MTVGSGYNLLGIVVVSDIRGPQFESCHWIFLLK